MEQDIGSRRTVIDGNAFRWMMRDAIHARNKDHGGWTQSRHEVGVMSCLTGDICKGVSKAVHGDTYRFYGLIVKNGPAPVPPIGECEGGMRCFRGRPRCQFDFGNHGISGRGVGMANVPNDLTIIGQDPGLVRNRRNPGRCRHSSLRSMLYADVIYGRRQASSCYQGVLSQCHGSGSGMRCFTDILDLEPVDRRGTGHHADLGVQLLEPGSLFDMQLEVGIDKLFIQRR